MYKIYTDGSYQDSIKSGGYSAVITENNHVVKVLYQGFKNTTNNRMELMGVLAALRYFKTPSEFEIVSDSAYVVNNINSGSAKRWFAESDFTKKNLDI